MEPVFDVRSPGIAENLLETTAKFLLSSPSPCDRLEYGIGRSHTGSSHVEQFKHTSLHPSDGARHSQRRAGVGLEGDRDENSPRGRSEEHTSELQSRGHLVCRLLLEKKTI